MGEERHYSFSELAGLMPTWGRTGEPEPLIKSLLQDIKAGDVALIRILSLINTVSKALAAEVYRREYNDELVKKRRVVEDFLAEEEVKHGPCPKSISEFLYARVGNSARRSAAENVIQPYYAGYYPPVDCPKKDTPLRVEWDRWKRRRNRKKPARHVANGQV